MDAWNIYALRLEPLPLQLSRAEQSVFSKTAWCCVGEEQPSLLSVCFV